MIARLITLGFLVALLCSSAIGQSRTTGAAEAKGTCSTANTGHNNKFVINCGIGEEQGQRMLAILNKILKDNLDTSAVMAKLDEIEKDGVTVRDTHEAQAIKDTGNIQGIALPGSAFDLCINSLRTLQLLPFMVGCCGYAHQRQDDNDVGMT